MHMRSRTFHVHVSIFSPLSWGLQIRILESLDRLGADIPRALLMPSGSFAPALACSACLQKFSRPGLCSAIWILARHLLGGAAKSPLQ